MLENVLTKECVALNVQAENWEDAVRYGGDMMNRLGMTEASYTEAMVRTVKEVGAYIVIAPSVAMPHARPEDGAKKVGTVIVTLKNPVEFGSPENDPVSVAVFLCAVDKTAHINLLADLMQLFEDDDFAREMGKMTSQDEALSYIKDKLRGE